MILLDRIEELCDERGISRRTMEIESGLSIGSTSKWLSGCKPTSASLKKVGSFFNVSVDYLLGDSPYRNDQDAAAAKWSKKWNSSGDTLGKVVPAMEIPILKDLVTAEEFYQFHLLEPIGWESVGEKMTRNTMLYGYHMHDDSLAPRIMGDDILIIDSLSAFPKNGDLVVAMIREEELIIGEFVKIEEGCIIQFYNPNYKPRFFSQAEIDQALFSVQGVVLEVRQKYKKVF